MSYIEKISNLEKITIEHLIDLKGILAVIKDSIELPKQKAIMLNYYDMYNNQLILNSNKDFFKAILDCSNRTDIENPDSMFIIVKILIDGIESNFIRISFLNQVKNRF